MEVKLTKQKGKESLLQIMKKSFRLGYDDLVSTMGWSSNKKDKVTSKSFFISKSLDKYEENLREKRLKNLKIKKN